MHLQECFVQTASHGTTKLQLPVAEQLAAECLSIPIYPELSHAQQDSVIAAIGDFLGLD
jgi:dTDP-4-amino-4,6-dideoxygalactose transaminase